MDALIDRSVAATDLADAQEAIREMQRRIYEDQPVTFLFWQDSVNAIDRRFQDVEMDTFTPLRRADRWWVPEGRQRY